MKKLNLYLLGLLLMLIPAIQSCGDDGYSLGEFEIRMATVRVVGGSTYYLETDNEKTLWPVATEIGWYKPVDGQRVIANVTVLSDQYDKYDHAIRVNFLTNILTKNVEELTEENQEGFGNDPADIRDIWIGGHYLNVEFVFNLPKYQKHRVSLVKNTLAEDPEDGYIHLEYRYNDQDDVSGVFRYSMVSFNLSEYINDEATSYKGIKIKANLIDEEEKIYTYLFTDKSESSREVDDPTDLVDGEGKVM
ncbi:NigD-like protein [Bacteroides sp. 224]|uniref:NigD-like protein n=1 Tax=Bacteroides sp. 224 TaxID=2302936 RepID=UPI0013D76DF6|nr:NigD-like protein [Bacteroides sp. 224]NDV65549.1 hypothetical protein [Bacteroides sp. 224]